MRLFISFVLALLILVTATLSAQRSDDAKPSPTPKTRASASTDESPSPTPRKKTAKAKKHISPSPKPKAKPTEIPEPDESPSPTAKHKVASHKSPSASPKRAKPSETPEPEESASPTEKRKVAAHKSPSVLPKAKAKKSDEEELKPTPKETPEETPRISKKKSAKELKGKKATARRTISPKPSETPEPSPTVVTRRAIPVATPAAPPAPSPLPERYRALSRATPEEPEQLTIEKYGYERPRGFWERIFGGGRRSSSGAGYRYLTRSVRNEIDRAPVRQGRWQYIVVHNSGTRQGNAAVFDYYHRHVRRMQNGLAYHFVIGNGTSTGNGEVEVGNRWRRQINGGHVHSDYLNNIALGICLVGDFNRDQPTRAQLDCCEELIRYLRQRCGKVGNHYPLVKPHREMNPPRWATDCPGDVFPYSWFRRFQE